MTKETRVGLLLGLIFIIAFGFILSGLNGPTGGSSSSKSVATQPSEKSQYFTQAPIVESVAADLQRTSRNQNEAIASEDSNIRERSTDRNNSGRAQLTISIPSDISIVPPSHEAAVQDRPAAERSATGSAAVSANIGASERRDQEQPAPASGRQANETREMNLDQLNANFGGRVQGQAQVQGQEQQRNAAKRVYVVRKGDSLTKIARQELKDGSSAAVRKILEANKDRINNPNNLPVGLELEIPAGARGI